MRLFTYPAIFEPGENPGVLVVTFPDVPEVVTEGNGEADARAMGSDALGVALLTIFEMKRPLPKPSRAKAGQVMLSVDADVAAKLAVLEAFRDAGITQAQLGERLGKDGREVRRILDPDHPTKMSTLTAALAALGRRLVIGVEAA